MRLYLDLLRKLRGLGLIDAQLAMSFPFTGLDGLRVVVRAADPRIGGFVSVDINVPLHDLSESHTYDLDEAVLDRAYRDIEAALERYKGDKLTCGDVVLRGYCDNCHKAVTYEAKKKNGSD